MPIKFVLVSTLVGFVGAASFNLDARAAPQALALLSTQGDVQLVCDGGQCAATFSSYCLQAERASPVAGTTYQLAGAEDIRVTGIDRQGRKISLDAAEALRFTAMRTQVAVRISIAESRLAELGLSGISVDVGQDATLLPMPLAGDGDPLSEAEIALATGPLRQAAARLVDRDSGRAATVRWLSGLVNALPEDPAREGQVRDALIRSVVDGAGMARLSGQARDLVHVALRSCNLDVGLQIYPSFRRCLESAHDAHLWNLNADYWLSVQAGS